MRMFSFSFSYDLVLDYKASLLSKDTNISRLVVDMQPVEDEKKRQVEMGER